MQQIMVLSEENSMDFSAFFEKIGDISDVFNDRFADFDLLKTKVELFNNPIEVDVESQPPYLQQELCELQSDPFVKKEHVPKRVLFVVLKGAFFCQARTRYNAF